MILGLNTFAFTTFASLGGEIDLVLALWSVLPKSTGDYTTVDQNAGDYTEVDQNAGLWTLIKGN